MASRSEQYSAPSERAQAGAPLGFKMADAWSVSCDIEKAKNCARGDTPMGEQKNGQWGEAAKRHPWRWRAEWRTPSGSKKFREFVVGFGLRCYVCVLCIGCFSFFMNKL